MHLTEKQCALLSGYMYLDQSVNTEDTIGTTINRLKLDNGQFKLDKLNPTGGITKKRALLFC